MVRRRCVKLTAAQYFLGRAHTGFFAYCVNDAGLSRCGLLSTGMLQPPCTRTGVRHLPTLLPSTRLRHRYALGLYAQRA